MVEIVYHCINLSFLSINWNGRQTMSFFVLCLERLGHLIQDSINKGLWKPLIFGKTKWDPNFSFFFFSDDIILVVEASLQQVAEVKRILDNFCLASR